ncbi:efflux RND transporter periplasmic adaptor subunit [Parapedobacter sp. 2B3]|uniref:efflux RND transporter periplasmic adaptor subunit n=1 Tax=Parapedobacter sp. 2B3 TaxID=3342381 RepID=UPI0035B57B9A
MSYSKFSFPNMLRLCAFLSWGVIAISCQQAQPTENQPIAETSLLQATEQPTEVETVTLEKTSFHQELIANGRLSAIRKADLRFRADGTVEQLHMTEGNRVQAGQLLANLNDETQQQALQHAALRRQKAVMDYEDQLLRLGYRAADTAALDEEVKQIARLRSGLSDALLEWRKAEKDVHHTKLYAPFAGKIANLKAKEYNNTAGLDYVCSLIDDRELQVEFAVLEQELDFVKHAKSVRVTAFSEKDRAYEGKVTSINPQVDRSGMVMVKAVIKNPDGGLIDGMGVSVVVSRDFGDQLSVPKEAVLDRQGRKVVFTATDGGTAYWNYVEISHENSTHYAIKDGLKPGDRVIYSGNFNLAHDKPITVQ